LQRRRIEEDILSSIQELDSTQLEAARVAAWHQGGDAVLTQEAAREWIAERGLVLFAPRSLQLPAPAPSLVEATLGAAKDAPTAADTAAARNLVARLVADGSIVPLNLLAVPGDVPDFVVSAQVFSYVFTLRGDKGWKLPPATSGAISVSPLGLHIHEVLAAAEGGRGAMTAAELASELGREVTETAILRALSELWSQLRVLPLLDQGGGPTMWELTTRRFTKAIKAGANAGQPKALSALISLYLGQVFAATEEEIATFLSPLTARSRVREVLRALTTSRQLETIAVQGKTLLHVLGGLPESVAVVASVDAEDVESEDVAAELPKPKKVGTGRISSFKSDAPKGSLRGKPAKSFGAKGAKSFGGARPTSRAGGVSAEGKPERERRPFKRDAAAGAKPAFKKEKPTFTKPWDEERKPPAAAVAKQDGFTKYRKPAPEDREPLGPREQAGLPVEQRTVPQRATKSFEKKTFDGKPAERTPYVKKAFGDKPAFGAKPYAKKTFGDKPSFGAKRPYAPRTAEGGDRPTFKPRSYEKRDGDKPYAKKSFGDKPSFGTKRPYTPRAAEGGERPAFKPRTFDRGDKPGFGAKRPYTPRTAEGGERPAFKPRSYEKRDGDKPFARKSFGDKPAFGAKRPYTPRSAEGGERPAFKPRTFDRGDRPAPKRAFKPKFDDAPMDGAPVERTIPRRPFKPRAEGHENRPFTKAPWTPPTDSGAGKRPYKARPAGGSGGKKPFGAKKAFGGGKKPGGFGPKRGS
jgi:23S rRNA pseudouridine2605 synthase